MNLPALTVYKDGINQVSGAQLNTFMQTCTNLAQLRFFIGIDGMEVRCRGAIVAGDGGGGDYYWNSQATAADNGTTVIVPHGAAGQGAWLLLPVGGAQSTSFYDLPVFLQGQPASGEVYPIFVCVRNVLLPVGLTLSQAVIGTNPTSTFVIQILKNGTIVGNITFSTLGVATFNFASQVAFVPGDRFSLQFPSPQDATAANVSITLVFSVGG